jgi:hypothetical protein
MKRAVLLTIAVAAAVLSGCAADPPATAPPPQDTHGDFVLPADAYAFTLPETGRIDLARELLAGKCMRRLGYTFDADAARREIPAGNDATVTDLGWYGNKRRYGVTDPAVAARYGYHLVNPNLGGTSQAPGFGALTPAMRTALTGTCTREATTALSPDGVVGEADVVAALGSGSFRDSLHDPTVTAAFAQWSTCMLKGGFHYASPAVAGTEFDIDSPRITPAETTAASADVLCKQRTHLIDIWHGFETTDQNTRIAQDPTAFAAAEAGHDAEMRRVGAVLAAEM